MSSSPTSPSGDASAEPPADPGVARSHDVDAPDGRAVTDAGSWLRFVCIAAIGLSLDLWSKHWAFDTLRQGGRWVIVPHVLEFQTMLNPGALFGVGGGQTTLFLVASAIALVLVGWMFLHSPRRHRLLHVALGAVLAGALGNMYDRAFVRLLERPVASPRGQIYLQVAGATERGFALEEFPPHEGGLRLERREVPRQVGFVRDFIKIPTRFFGGRELWPWVFNVADMLLVGGVSILAIYLWADRRGEQRAGRAAARSEPESVGASADPPA